MISGDVLLQDKCSLFILLAVNIIVLPPIRAADLCNCQQGLGMETGVIPDEAISASSSYEQSVGPAAARIRQDIKGGAWCPRKQITDDVYEWIQIDLQGINVITQVETQGRFSHGQGQEYAEYYMLEYQRIPSGPWLNFTDLKNNRLIQGNNNTYTAQLRDIVPPIIAQKIRIVPYSKQPKLVCMRVELYGCPWRVSADAPGNFSAITISKYRVHLHWTPPVQSHNGEIIVYELTYHKRLLPFDETTLNASDTSVIVESLEPNTEYVFKIRAINSQGAGPWSFLTFRTYGSLSDRLENFTPIAISQYSVRLQWDPPAIQHHNGEIILYELMYYKRLLPFDEMTLNTSETSVIVESLEPNTEYVFKIRAINSQGAGPWSFLTFRTYGSLSDRVPENLIPISISQYSIRLQWDPPAIQHHNDKIILYELMYYKRPLPFDEMTLNTSETSVIVESLEPNTEYVFKIRAINSQGAGPWSNLLILRTYSPP